MFRNVHYESSRNLIHLWETINGVNEYTTYDWVPYVYVLDNNGDIKTIDGRNVRKVEFDSYNSYYEFCKDNVNVFENKVKPEIQFLAERYYKIPDDEIEVPQLLTYSFDIEVIKEKGFPDPMKAEDPICLISLINSITKETITFGEKPYNGEGKYFHCKLEAELLRKFFDFLSNNMPDAYSGWNIYGFDLPYIINRSKKLFGEDTSIYKAMSPIRVVKTWKQKNEDAINIDIAGVHILDYLDVYKWYSPNKLESYKLDFVSKFELEKGKVDYSEFEDLRELYRKDWNKFVVYNRVDCERVDQLEDKLGYIRLIQALSLLTKCPMKFYAAMTHLIEGALLTHYRRNNMCAPYFAGGTQEGFEAAFVKEPQSGMHDWVIDIDITSSYPSHIITLNMSNETYFGRIIDTTEDRIVSQTRNREFQNFTMLKPNGLVEFNNDRLHKFNEALKRGLFAIAPCGSVFITKPKGVIADVEQNIFAKRKDVKGKMKLLRQEAAEKENPKEKEKLEVRAKELFSLQWAIKILLNAVFGITAVPYSRYFNTSIAEAITSCGRHTIKQGQVFVNEYYNNKKLKTKITDWVKYIDTDSLFIGLGDYMKLIHSDWEDISDDDKVKLILKEAKEIEKYVNDRVYSEVQKGDYNSQVEDFKIGFKQEIVAKKALFVKKKKYAYWCINEEGVPVDKLSVTGLEIVRSDSSEAIRERLKVVYEMILKDKSEKEIIDVIERYKKELKSVAPEEMAANISVNNISKYIIKGQPIKGTPWHIKGVANYRKLLKELKLENKYEDIHESTKAKVIYLKKNAYGADTVSFNRWPIEFNDVIEPDYDVMIDKFFLNKIGFLLEPMNKMHLLENKSVQKSLNLFFG
jgi:DNA polymerase elongation subunit (family B)